MAWDRLRSHTYSLHIVRPESNSVKHFSREISCKARPTIPNAFLIVPDDSGISEKKCRARHRPALNFCAPGVYLYYPSRRSEKERRVTGARISFVDGWEQFSRNVAVGCGRDQILSITISIQYTLCGSATTSPNAEDRLRFVLGSRFPVTRAREILSWNHNQT